MGAESTDNDYALLRHRMVEEQLRRRGIVDGSLLEVMESLPRHLFVPPAQRGHAYKDEPLPIGLQQTISQPYMVARMTELLHLTKGSRVLEIGTGSGYQTAVLAELAAEVLTIERLPELTRAAANLLHRLGYYNVRVIPGDGTLGFAEEAPYDAIVVTAGAPRVPDALREQLAIDGRMVIPVAAGQACDLLLIERLDDAAESATPAGSSHPPVDSPAHARCRETTILSCVFVPLIGADGYGE
jgi:protein-L-isoaspartate(D-aspartate) O-methyltransferase